MIIEYKIDYSKPVRNKLYTDRETCELICKRKVTYCSPLEYNFMPENLLGIECEKNNKGGYNTTNCCHFFIDRQCISNFSEHTDCGIKNLRNLTIHDLSLIFTIKLRNLNPIYKYKVSYSVVMTNLCNENEQDIIKVFEYEIDGKDIQLDIEGEFEKSSLPENYRLCISNCTLDIITNS